MLRILMLCFFSFRVYLWRHNGGYLFKLFKLVFFLSIAFFSFMNSDIYVFIIIIFSISIVLALKSVTEFASATNEICPQFDRADPFNCLFICLVMSFTLRWFDCFILVRVRSPSVWASRRRLVHMSPVRLYHFYTWLHCFFLFLGHKDPFMDNSGHVCAGKQIVMGYWGVMPCYHFSATVWHPCISKEWAWPSTSRS